MGPLSWNSNALDPCAGDIVITRLGCPVSFRGQRQAPQHNNCKVTKQCPLTCGFPGKSGLLLACQVPVTALLSPCQMTCAYCHGGLAAAPRGHHWPCGPCCPCLCCGQHQLLALGLAAVLAALSQALGGIVRCRVVAAAVGPGAGLAAAQVVQLLLGVPHQLLARQERLPDLLLLQELPGRPAGACNVHQASVSMSSRAVPAADAGMQGLYAAVLWQCQGHAGCCALCKFVWAHLALLGQFSLL